MLLIGDLVFEMERRERDEIGRRTLENHIQVPDLEARPGRDQQGGVADPALLPHQWRQHHHAVGRQGDMFDKPEGAALARIMRLQVRAEEHGSTILEIPLLLRRENPVVDDQAGRFLMQADKQPAIRRSGYYGFVEVARQDDFPTGRHLTDRAAYKEFVHSPSSPCQETMVNEL